MFSPGDTIEIIYNSEYYTVEIEECLTEDSFLIKDPPEALSNCPVFYRCDIAMYSDFETIFANENLSKHKNGKYKNYRTSLLFEGFGQGVLTKKNII